MPSEIFELVALCRKVREASDDELRGLDRSSVAAVIEALEAMREQLDFVLARLESLDEESSH
jgi:hypothetical protein